MSNTHTALELVLPDIDCSVHNSPDQSECKNTEKGLTFTGVLIFCCILLVKTYCKNNAIESHKGVISVIKIRGIATFDIKVHFCSGLMWDSVTMHRMKQTKQKSVKEIKNFHNLMQGAPWLMRFNFRGVHPGFRQNSGCTLVVLHSECIQNSADQPSGCILDSVQHSGCTPHSVVQHLGCALVSEA